MTLRHYLLKHGFDSKTSDMSDCTLLKAFKDTERLENNQNTSREASILEICVYPVIAQDKMRRLGQDIRAWAGLSEYVISQVPGVSGGACMKLHQDMAKSKWGRPPWLAIRKVFKSSSSSCSSS